MDQKDDSSVPPSDFKNLDQLRARLKVGKENLRQTMDTLKTDQELLWSALRGSIRDYRSHLDKAEEQKRAILQLVQMISELEDISGTNSPPAILLTILAQGAATLTELCELSGLRNDSVSQYLNSMEKKGFVTRVLEPNRKRGASYVFNRIPVPHTGTDAAQIEIHVQANTSGLSHPDAGVRMRRRSLKAKNAGNLTNAYVDPTTRNCPGNNSEYPLAG